MKLTKTHTSDHSQVPTLRLLAASASLKHSNHEDWESSLFLLSSIIHLPDLALAVPHHALMDRQTTCVTTEALCSADASASLLHHAEIVSYWMRPHFLSLKIMQPALLPTTLFAFWKTCLTSKHTLKIFTFLIIVVLETPQSFNTHACCLPSKAKHPHINTRNLHQSSVRRLFYYYLFIYLRFYELMEMEEAGNIS